MVELWHHFLGQPCEVQFAGYFSQAQSQVYPAEMLDLIENVFQRGIISNNSQQEEKAIEARLERAIYGLLSLFASNE